ncbi:unnamed protein product [Amoebophrya sp. A120]|nr:unnamed protein product [Amoebophrya sp. A120]|eukprot:GSA120T00001445001.1
MLRDKALWHSQEAARSQEAAWKVFRDLVAEQDEVKRREDESWSWIAEAGEAADFVGLQRDETFKQSNLASEEHDGEGDGVVRPDLASGPPGGQGPGGGNTGDEAGAHRETAPGNFLPGQMVLVYGLKSRPELNGKEGRLETFLPKQGRWQVRLSSAATGQAPILLKPENIRAKFRLPGQRVRISGLVSKPELNGEEGRLGDVRLTSSGERRWEVRITPAARGQGLVLRPENISVVSVSDPEVPAAHAHCTWVREFFAQALELQKTWSGTKKELKAENVERILFLLELVFRLLIEAHQADGYVTFDYETAPLQPRTGVDRPKRKRKCFPRAAHAPNETGGDIELRSEQARKKAKERGCQTCAVKDSMQQRYTQQYDGSTLDGDMASRVGDLKIATQAALRKWRKSGEHDPDDIDELLREYVAEEFQRLREIAILEMAHLNDPRHSEAYPLGASGPIQAVRLFDLEGSPELNGKKGLLGSLKAQKGQWVVEWISEHGRKFEELAQPKNIKICGAAGPAENEPETPDVGLGRGII